MAIEKLSHREKEIVLTCIRAIAKGPFINDWEIPIRLGVPRSTLHRMIEVWPDVDDSVDDSDETLAINGAMNEVCYGIPFSNGDWQMWFNVEESVIEAVYTKWKQLRKCHGS
jgi:hypothetical protein